MASTTRSKTGGTVEYGVEDLDRAMAEMKLVSQISRDFINNALDPDLQSVPGIGKRAIGLLAEQGIETTDELVGQFFCCNRNEIKFIDFLEQIGITNKNARECAKQFGIKLGRI